MVAPGPEKVMSDAVATVDGGVVVVIEAEPVPALASIPAAVTLQFTAAVLVTVPPDLRPTAIPACAALPEVVTVQFNAVVLVTVPPKFIPAPIAASAPSPSVARQARST